MNYEYEVDLKGDNALAYVLELVGFSKKVLEIGAGSGMITKYLVSTKNCDVVALEINPKSVEKLKSYVDRVYSLDLNDAGWIDHVAKEGKFDVIVAADVLEHLYDPWSVLRNMRRLLKSDGSIVLSLPHVAHAAIVSCFFEEDFHYREWGLLDKTHIRFFGLHNIAAMHDSVGLAIADARFVIRRPEETEFAEQWSALPKHVRIALNSNPHGHVYQVVTKAMSAEHVSAPIDLAEASLKRYRPEQASLLQKLTAAIGLSR
jgi:2-polyprenyl-3-methyl-5-hydroxy-6-metoxy-1,4-benzoquinol methylase